jgi:cytochrome c-type biogenesis protein CcmH
MALWIVFALMTAAAIFAVLWPLSRSTTKRGGSDIAVYRDQLDEVARDRASGLIGEAEAEAARIEVSRRLLAAADADAEQATPSDTAPSPLWRRRAVAVIALVLLPVGASLLYLKLGSPNLPGAPLVERAQTPGEGRSIEELVAQVEQRAAANPDDGRAWDVLAPVYMRLGRFEDSARAWRNSIRLNGATASRETDYGEALIAAANGMITMEAKAAFDRALALDKDDVKTRFYLGLAADQDGKRADAEKIWRDLLTNAPPDAPWAPMVRQQLARIAPNAAVPDAKTPGPSAGDVEAAGKMSADEQRQMIGGMVARLADRLKQDGSDVEGWLRLVRAYSVMGERDKAVVASADAKRALAAEPDKLRRVDELIKELGLQG